MSEKYQHELLSELLRKMYDTHEKEFYGAYIITKMSISGDTSVFVYLPRIKQEKFLFNFETNDELIEACKKDYEVFSYYKQEQKNV